MCKTGKNVFGRISTWSVLVGVELPRYAGSAAAAAGRPRFQLPSLVLLLLPVVCGLNLRRPQLDHILCRRVKRPPVTAPNDLQSCRSEASFNNIVCPQG
jgi:hypothetical protein